MKTLSIFLGTLSSSTIGIFFGIAIFIYFMFKIYKNNDVSLRYSLIMALLGILIVVLSQTIDAGYSSGVDHSKNGLLIYGIILTAYGGFVSINKFLKDKEKSIK